jgi:hypothetical protein
MPLLELALNECQGAATDGASQMRYTLPTAPPSIALRLQQPKLEGDDVCNVHRDTHLRAVFEWQIDEWSSALRVFQAGHASRLAIMEETRSSLIGSAFMHFTFDA